MVSRYYIPEPKHSLPCLLYQLCLLQGEAGDMTLTQRVVQLVGGWHTRWRVADTQLHSVIASHRSHNTRRRGREREKERQRGRQRKRGRKEKRESEKERVDCEWLCPALKEPRTISGHERTQGLSLITSLWPWLTLSVNQSYTVSGRTLTERDILCMSSKCHHIHFALHYFWPGVHYKGNRVAFGTQPKSNWT